ncbi:MAG: hypothetical protein IJL48_11925 [Bacteroidales bacterium]|nr:hypothetical protein [Bacteroidales bacterium]
MKIFILYLKIVLFIFVPTFLLSGCRIVQNPVWKSNADMRENVLVVRQVQLPAYCDTVIMCSICKDKKLYIDGVFRHHKTTDSFSDSISMYSYDTINITRIQIKDSDYYKIISLAGLLATSYNESYSIPVLDGASTCFKVFHKGITREITFDNITTKRIDNLFYTLNWYLEKLDISFRFDTDVVGYFDDEADSPSTPKIQMRLFNK